VGLGGTVDPILCLRHRFRQRSEELSDNSIPIDYASDLSEDNIDRREKFVLSLEIRALNDRIKHCAIHYYYTMGGALTISMCIVYDSFH